MEPSTRKVVTRSPARTVRVVNLRGRLAGPVECESSLERDFVFRAVLHPAVINVTHQPFQLHLPDGRRYTPDFLLTLRSGQRLVVEVKPRAKMDQYRELFDHATGEFERRGLDFAVADDVAIRGDRAHERAAAILRYRKGAFAPHDCDRAVETAADHAEGMALGLLADRAGVSTELILHLMANVRLLPGPDLAIAPSAAVHPLNPLEENCHADQLARWLGLAAW